MKRHGSKLKKEILIKYSMEKCDCLCWGEIRLHRLLGKLRCGIKEILS